MPDQTPSMPPLPEPVAHMHSNGDFCQDMNVVSREWPVYLYTAEQVQAVADERVRASEGMAQCMALVHRGLIDAGVVSPSVPPMMLPEAIIGFIVAARRNSRRYLAFFEAGLPITFEGVEYRTKAELDAAIDARISTPSLDPSKGAP